MTPKLKSCFTLRGYLSKENTIDLKAIKGGPSRIIVPITHGFLRGSGLNAEIVPGGADWLLLDPSTQTAHLDVRTQARDEDGHGVYLHYSAVLKLDDATNKVLSWSKDAVTTAYGDHEFFGGPIMETSSPDLKWVETSLFVAQGHWVVEGDSNAVEYEVYRVTN